MMAVLPDYVAQLVALHPGIHAVWLIGSRARGMERPGSDWDLLIFADVSILSRLSADDELRRRSAELRIVEARPAWPDPLKRDK